MKKIFLVFSCIVFGALRVYAQDVPEGLSVEMLQGSLSELKKSYSDLVERNAYLRTGIAFYQQDLPLMLKELEIVKFKKEALKADGLDEEDLEGKMDVFVIYEQEIKRLRKQLEATDEKSEQAMFFQKKEGLNSSLGHSREDIQKAQLRLQEVQRQYARQKETMAHLWKKQQDFSRQVLKQSGNLNVDGKRIEVKQADFEADKYKESYLVELTDDIAHLKLYQQQLEGKLATRGSIDSSGAMKLADEQYQMYGKLSSLKDENVLLKRQLYLIGLGSTTNGQVSK